MEDSNMDSLATIQPGRLEGLNINGIYTFLGIPYAKPPVGPLRWHAPEPPERWEGVRPAKQFGTIAIQTTGACFTLRETRQSEDCLSLNIGPLHWIAKPSSQSCYGYIAEAIYVGR